VTFTASNSPTIKQKPFIYLDVCSHYK
jgi:hypothetical protein